MYPILEKDVPKVVQAIRQTTSRKVLSKLMTRIKVYPINTAHKNFIDPFKQIDHRRSSGSQTGHAAARLQSDDQRLGGSYCRP